MICGARGPEGATCIRLPNHISYSSHWGYDESQVWGEKVTFLNGPLAGVTAELRYLPPMIEVGGTTYERVDDPDTGAPLGGYALAEGET